MTIAYKVVRSNLYKFARDGLYCEYQSAVVQRRALVTYEIGKWSTAPKHLATRGYHLTVFSSLSRAKRYIQEMDDSMIVLECVCEGRVDLPVFLSPAIGLDDDAHIDFLIESLQNEHHLRSRWLSETLMFERVMPIRIA